MKPFWFVPPALLMVAVVSSFAPAGAAPPPHGESFSAQVSTDPPDDDDSAKTVQKSRYAGVVEGQVMAIDYRTGVMSVQTGNKRIDVVVLPSTNIQGHTNSFHTIADIAKGARIQVFMSQRGSSFVAEIIHLH